MADGAGCDFADLDKLLAGDLTDDLMISPAVNRANWREEGEDGRFEHVEEGELVNVLSRIADSRCNIEGEAIIAGIILSFLNGQEAKVMSIYLQDGNISLVSTAWFGEKKEKTRKSH